MKLKFYGEVKKYFTELHDVECNQKYASYLNNPIPYSFHLEMVELQYKKFSHLIGDKDTYVVLCSIWAHDAIEDARLTYNDIVDLIGEEAADIVYCCTEEKGKNRKERHSVKYFMDLADNKLAIFVKLCDIIANIKFGLLTNSRMLPKYKAEYEMVKEYLYTEEYKEMFEYMESIFSIK